MIIDWLEWPQENEGKVWFLFILPVLFVILTSWHMIPAAIMLALGVSIASRHLEAPAIRRYRG